MDKEIYFKEPSIEEFDKWFHKSFIRQAEDRAFMNQTDIETEEAELGKMVQILLPNGKDTPSHDFSLVYNQEHVNIGFIWFGELPEMPDNMIFLFDIMVEDAYQNKGYGKQMLLIKLHEMKDLGYNTCVLFVRKDNLNAIHLYRKLGFDVIHEETGGFQMQKEL